MKTLKDAEAEVQKWLAVLARCFQLSDAVAVLELDRVLDASPDELDRHRLGLEAARKDRLDLITQHTERLLERMGATVETANSNVLRHPTKSPAVVKSSNHVALGVGEFHGLLGIEAGRAELDATSWRAAASDRWDRVRVAGGERIDDVKQLGSETRHRAWSMGDKLRDKLPERTSRRAGDVDDQSDAAVSAAEDHVEADD